MYLSSELSPGFWALKSLSWESSGECLWPGYGPPGINLTFPPASDVLMIHNLMKSWWKFNFPQWVVDYSALWHLNSWSHSHWAFIALTPTFLFPQNYLFLCCCFCAYLSSWMTCQLFCVLFYWIIIILPNPKMLCLIFDVVSDIWSQMKMINKSFVSFIEHFLGFGLMTFFYRAKISIHLSQI